MDLHAFKKILDNTVLPASLTNEQQEKAVEKLNGALSGFFPKKLYKYRRCCESHINAFFKNQVWVSNPQTMNDGFDARMFFDKEEVIKNVRDKMNDNVIQSFIDALKHDQALQEQISQAPGGPEALANLCLPDTYIEDGIKSARDALIPEINRIIDILPSLTQQSLKIACFSGTVKSSSMWGQYAEDETGFCLEYCFERSDELSWFDDGRSRSCSIYPIIYQPERFLVASSFIEYLIEYQLFFKNGLIHRKMEDSATIQNQINSFLSCPDLFMTTKIALHKSEEWKFEQEWRLFCNSDDVAFQRASKGYFVKKPTALYLGRRISEVNEKFLTILGDEKGIPIYKMELNDSSPSYDLIPIKIL